MAPADDPKFEHDEPIEVPYPELYALFAPVLRRLKRTEGVQRALEDLRGLLKEDSSGPWSATKEARIRLAALALFEEYVAQRLGHSGAVPLEEFQKCEQMRTALRIVRTCLREMPAADMAARELLHVHLVGIGIVISKKPIDQGCFTIWAEEFLHLFPKLRQLRFKFLKRLSGSQFHQLRATFRLV